MNKNNLLNWLSKQFSGRFRRSVKAQSTAWYGGTSIVCQLLRFGGVIYSTRLLEPEQFGLFAQATMALALACLVQELGQTNGLVAYKGSDLAYSRFHFQSKICLTLVAAVGLWLTVGVFAFGPVGLADAVPLLLGIMLVEALGATGIIMCQKKFWFKFLGLVEIGAVLCWLVTLYFLSQREMCFTILLWARLAETGFRVALVFAAEGWRHVGLAWNSELVGYYIHKFVRYSAPENVVTGIIQQLDVLLLSNFSTTVQVGLYERIQQFIKIPLSLSINLIDRVALMSYSKSQDQPRELRRHLIQFNLLLLFMLLSSVAIITVLLPWFLKPLVGAEWEQELMHLWWFAIPFALLRPIGWSLSIFLRGTGRVRKLLIGALLLGLTKLTYGLILVYYFGAQGMLVAVAIAWGVANMYFFIQCHRSVISTQVTNPYTQSTIKS